MTLYVLCAGPFPGATAQTLIDAAYALGYDALSDRMLDELILAAVCQ